MTRGIKVVGGLIVLLLAIPLAVRFGPAHSQRIVRVNPRPSISSVAGSLTVVDRGKPWTPRWMEHGIPPTLHHTGRLPWIVADPQNPTRTWWFWPRVVQGALWMGTSDQQTVTWHPLLSGHSPGASWPTPVRQTIQWVHSLESGRGAIPASRIEPAGAFGADMSTVTGVTGWEASMEPTPRTIVMTWGLQQRKAQGLRFITMWHWQPTGWQCTMGILQHEPTVQLATRSETAAIPHPLPGWAVATKS